MAIESLRNEDWTLIQEADRGDAEAQNDLAMILLGVGKAEAAIYWLELAAAKDHPDALHWLARCHIDGQGVLADKHRGLMYLAKSAALGHLISRAQVDRLTVSRSGLSSGTSAQG